MFEVIIDTTDKCFMNCKYCGTNSKRDGHSFLNYKKIIEIIFATKKVYENHIIYFGGGCFFCHSHWEEILEANKKIKANIRIDIPLYADLCLYLDKCAPSDYNYSVSLSLWGIDDVQNNLSGTNSFYAFENLVETISKYQKERYLSFVVTKELINQQKRIADFINKFNYNTSIYFHRLMPTGRSSSELLPELKDVQSFCKKIEEENKNGVKLSFHHTIFSEMCKAYKSRIFINHDGKVYGCGWIDDKTEYMKNIHEINSSMTELIRDLKIYDKYKDRINKCVFF